jgi:mono/diheme cytochrome c family protein
MAKETSPGDKAQRASVEQAKQARRDTLQSSDFPNESADVGKLHEPIMREKREPRDGYEPVPLWLVGICFALIFWGGWYLAWYSGGFRGDVLDERPSFGAVAVADSDGPIDPLVLGEKLYTGRCVSCHQQNGQGIAGQYPPLVQSEWVLTNPQRLKRILLHGLEGPITVAGASYNGNMPAFGKVLDDAKIAAVLTYVRNSWGNEAEPLTAESMAATRTATSDRSAPWTAAELLAVTSADYATPPEPKSESEPDPATEPTTEPAPGPAPEKAEAPTDDAPDGSP